MEAKKKLTSSSKSKTLAVKKPSIEILTQNPADKKAVIKSLIAKKNATSKKSSSKSKASSAVKSATKKEQKVKKASKVVTAAKKPTAKKEAVAKNIVNKIKKVTSTTKKNTEAKTKKKPEQKKISSKKILSKKKTSTKLNYNSFAGSKMFISANAAGDHIECIVKIGNHCNNHMEDMIKNMQKVINQSFADMSTIGQSFLKCKNAVDMIDLHHKMFKKTSENSIKYCLDFIDSIKELTEKNTKILSKNINDNINRLC